MESPNPQNRPGGDFVFGVSASTCESELACLVAD